METPAAAMAAKSVVKEESAALVGGQIGHYQIIREIGRGGMGVVYLAEDTSLGRQVALKVLPKHLISDPDRLRRFEREARAASALNHPNILTIQQLAQVDSLHFIATEFIDGVTLRMANTQRDPVCGMNVDPQDAAGTSQHQGRTYYFCSDGCKKNFEQNPRQYAKGQGQSAGKSA
jgi:serine/threonine protein kinase